MSSFLPEATRTVGASLTKSVQSLTVTEADIRSSKFVTKEFVISRCLTDIAFVPGLNEIMLGTQSLREQN